MLNHGHYRRRPHYNTLLYTFITFLLLPTPTTAQGALDLPVLQCVNRLRKVTKPLEPNFNDGFEQCNPRYWTLQNLELADNQCCVTASADEDEEDDDNKVLGSMSQRIPIGQGYFERIDSWGFRGYLEAEFKVRSPEALLSEKSEPDAPIVTYSAIFKDADENVIDTDIITSDFWFNPMLRTDVENPVSYNQTVNSAIIGFHQTVSEIVVVPSGTRWIELKAQLRSRNICVRMLQLNATASLAQPTWVSDFIGFISLAVLILSTLPFAFKLLPKYRRKQAKDAPFRSTVNVFARQPRKLWVSLLFVMNSVMMYYTVSFIQSRFLEDADIAAEVYITILLTIGLMIIGLVFLPVHLAQESAGRSKTAVGWGIYCMIMIVIQLPFHYFIFRDLDDINSFFVPVGYAAWPVLNVMVLGYFLWAFRQPKFADGEGEGAGKLNNVRYDKRSMAYSLTHMRPSLSRENRYVAEMLRDYDASDDVANMHPMAAFRPTAIFKHLASKRSSLRQGVVPLPLQTSVVAIVLVAWMVVNQTLSSFFDERALEACTFPRIIPYVNFYLAEWTSITLPSVRFTEAQLESLTAQFYGVFTAGASISIGFTVLLLVYHIGGMITAYDIDIAKLRRGDYARITYAPTFEKDFTLKDAAAYMGTQVGFGFFGIAFTATIFFFFFTGICMILSLEGIQRWLLSVLQRLAPLVLAVLFSFLLGYFLDRQFERNIAVPGTGFWIKHPGHWSIHHYFMFPVALLESILGFIGRIIANTMGVVFYSMRLDVANQVGLLSFIERSGGVYSAFLLADHHYSNPVMWSFLFITATTAADRAHGIDPSTRTHIRKDSRPSEAKGHSGHTKIRMQDLESSSSQFVRKKAPTIQAQARIERRRTLKKTMQRPTRPITLISNDSTDSLDAPRDPDPSYLALSLEHKRMIARTRWFLAYTLLKNPELISQRLSARKRQWWRYVDHQSDTTLNSLTSLLDPTKLADRALDGSRKLFKTPFNG